LGLCHLPVVGVVYAASRVVGVVARAGLDGEGAVAELVLVVEEGLLRRGAAVVLPRVAAAAPVLAAVLAHVGLVVVDVVVEAGVEVGVVGGQEGGGGEGQGGEGEEQEGAEHLVRSNEQ